jgi:hypothetical protein
VVSLLRFAIKATRTKDIQPVPSTAGSHKQIDISSALEVMRKSESVTGIPEGIDDIPCELDYPSVDLSGTKWRSFDDNLEAVIARANWKCIVLRSTTPSPYNKPHKFAVNDEAQGWKGICRPRVLSVSWRDLVTEKSEQAEFELDSLNIEERARLYSACLKNVVFGFDLTETLNWMSHELKKITGETPKLPERVVDLNLVGRVLRPTLPMELQVNANKDKTARAIVAKGGSGWSIEGFASVVLGLPTCEFSKNHGRNWCAPAPLEEDVRAEVHSVTSIIYRCFEKLTGMKEDMDLLDAWDECVMERNQADVTHLHNMQHYPQALCQMHLKGMPFSMDAYRDYSASLEEALEENVAILLQEVPELHEFESDFLDIHKGQSERLKQAIGKAFIDRGLSLEYTKGSPRLPKVGEKDLRGAGATQNPKTEPLFKALITIGKIKRYSETARNLAEFAERSEDSRLRSIYTPSASTLRLTSIEPNCQALPGIQSFRNMVEAIEDHSVVAFDFSAMDVRNGAALAIRSQKVWLEALKTGNLSLLTKDKAMIKALDEALSSQNPSIELMALERNMHRLLDKAKSSGNWSDYEYSKKRYAAHRAANAWLKILPKAKNSKDGCWGGLREAFQLNADVHAYTGLRFNGKDPAKMIREELGDSPDRSVLKSWWDKTAQELGPVRRRGKISNLSLLYAMTLEGFLKDAAQKFDEHWTLEEAGTYYSGWYSAFPEIELMNCMMEMQAITHDSNNNRLMGHRLKDEGKGYRKALSLFKCRTLADRILYAEGLNAGLNYGNQGTGADILMRAVVDLKSNHREVFGCLMNQVHDELVSMFPDKHLEEFRAIKESVLLKHACEMTEPFGVPMDVSCTVGKVWIKD